MIDLYGHPFSSYTWKALIACYENDVAFTYKMVDPDHEDNMQALAVHSPQKKFPLLVDGGVAVFEASIIIEYLQLHHPGRIVLIPQDPDAALDVRMLDRFFDNYVMSPMQQIVGDYLREPDSRDPLGVANAEAMLQQSYRWLESRMQARQFACGDDFTLADCAAAPSLFYADWVSEIPADCTAARAYRARLLSRPSVKRCVDDARPYRSYFPPGAPDRD